MDIGQTAARAAGARLDVVEELEELLASEFVQGPFHTSAPFVDNLDRGALAAVDRSAGEARADHGGKRIDSFVEAMKAAKAQGKRLAAEEVSAQILQLAAAGYSEESQEQFIRDLRKRLALKDGSVSCKKTGAELANVLTRLRPALPGKRVGLTGLRRFFEQQGFRLRSFDPEPEPSVSKQVDRREARKTLGRFRDACAPISKRAVREYLAHFAETVDKDDLAWGVWQVDGRVRTGRFTFENREARDLFYGFFDTRLAGVTTHKNATFLRARALRMRIDAGETREEITAATEDFLQDASALRDDPDGLFFAYRVLGREMRKVRAPDSGELVERVSSAADRFFQPRLDGVLDRYTERQRIRRAVERGDMREVDSWRLLAAVSVSETVTEYRLAQSALHFQVQLIIFEAMQEAAETVNRNLSGSGDIVDSDGNVIISGLELYLERLEKERLVLERLSDARELDALASRMGIDAQLVDAVLAYTAARTPAEQSDAAGEIARFLSLRASIGSVVSD